MRLSQPRVRTVANHTDRPSLLHRFTAGLGVALVLWMAWLAADPAAHHALHAQEHDGCDHTHADADHGDAQADDHGCVIAKFAHGQVEALVAPVVCAAPLMLEITGPLRADDVAHRSPSHRLPPGCGPPAA
jgi:hypothetical protein